MAESPAADFQINFRGSRFSQAANFSSFPSFHPATAATAEEPTVPVAEAASAIAAIVPLPSPQLPPSTSYQSYISSLMVLTTQALETSVDESWEKTQNKTRPKLRRKNLSALRRSSTVLWRACKRWLISIYCQISGNNVIVLNYGQLLLERYLEDIYSVCPGTRIGSHRFREVTTLDSR
ncbi:hypothetical protein HZH68_005405 [Vespula germanica]|uniref:Uncharacterized protein n=1 Tax=Vespula germanica TaxID=30212 RepID=A0A834KL47_VESGE|nr:hypothetical protein HZH68_005405 [Vespula germanica]